MKETVQTVVVDCEQCFREETVSGSPPIRMLPEKWIEINEGPPFGNNYQFCTPECFIAWYARDEDERLTEYYERRRARETHQAGEQPHDPIAEA